MAPGSYPDELKDYERKYCSDDCRELVSRKVARPTKSELEKMLVNSSYCEIGRKFGVSDNAVRKWAKKYGSVS